LILKYLDQDPACAEQNDGTKLGVGTRAQDQFVAFEVYHRLNAHAKEMARPNLFLDVLLDFYEGLRDLLGGFQVETNPAHVGFVRDCV